MDSKENKVLIEARKNRKAFPLIGLPYIAAITPLHIEVKIIDEVNGLQSDALSEEADLVGITGMTMHANRMYELADRFREKEVPVILGGIHVTYMPEEALNHADAIVIGEAEEVWSELLKDFEKGQLKKIYKSDNLVSIDNLPFPKLELLNGPAYQPPKGTLNAVMTTRGCPNNCDFCCVTQMFGQKFRTRPIESVIKEIECLNKDFISFNDDNIIGKPIYAKELFKALKPLNRYWGGQASIKIGEDTELLNLAHESGCRLLFIGIESVNQSNIDLINKKGVNQVTKYKDSLKRIQDKGIRIIGSFIIGLDDDDEGVIDQIFDFIEDNHIAHPVVNILTPFPGTRLFEQLERENRIIDRDWSHYDLTHVVIKPKKMSPEKLMEGYIRLLGKLNRYQYRRTLEKFYT